MATADCKPDLHGLLGFPETIDLFTHCAPSVRLFPGSVERCQFRDLARKSRQRALAETSSTDSADSIAQTRGCAYRLVFP